MGYMGDEKIKAYFMSLDIDVSSATKVFNLLDQEKTGNVELEKFVGGCLKYRGTAKNVDVAILSEKVDDVLERVDSLADAHGASCSQFKQKYSNSKDKYNRKAQESRMNGTRLSGLQDDFA